MLVQVEISGKSYQIDLGNGIDISQSFGNGGNNPGAFFIPAATANPITVGDYVGSVIQGSGANCDIIQFCAHGNVTHTEGCGHITKEQQSVNKILKEYFFIIQLISVTPEQMGNGDLVITAQSVSNLTLDKVSGVVVRTLPNAKEKIGKNYSGQNPAYFDSMVLEQWKNQGLKHLLTDLPSVDREEDGGKMLAHKAWFMEGENYRDGVTITEFIYVPDFVQDGKYFLNLQLAPLESDASPSRPVLFALQEI